MERPNDTRSAPATQRINRRLLLGGAAGIAATLTGIGYTAAQESTPSSTPATDETNQTATLIERAGKIIALVEADRAAVTNGADLTMADQLLAFAGDLLDQATGQPATSRDEINRQLRLAAGAGGAAMAARQVLVAGLSAFGLPSQQGPVSHRLADTFDAITSAGADINAANVPEAATALDFAQQLYSDAYTTYGSALYDAASHQERAATRMLRIAGLLTGEGDGAGLWNGDDNGGGWLERRRRRQRRRDRRAGTPDLDERQTPVDVPAPPS